MADDTPGDPTQRTIGGVPLADIGSDGGGSGGGGGGGTSGVDDMHGTEQFSRAEVVESIERGVDVDKVNDPDEFAEGAEPRDREPAQFEFDRGGEGFGAVDERDGSAGFGVVAPDRGDEVVVAGPPPALADTRTTTGQNLSTDDLDGTQPQREPIQATESPALPEATFRSDPDIRESLTSGGALREQDQGGPLPSEQQLSEASQQFQRGLDAVGEISGEGMEALGAPVRATADAATGDFAGAAEEVRAPAGGSFRAGAEAANEASREGAGVGEAVGTGLRATVDAAEGEDDSVGERALEGATRGVGQVGDLPGLGLTAEAGVEFGEGVVAEGPDQPAETAATAGALGSAVGAAAAQQAAESASENPAGFAGQIAGGLAGGTAVGTVTSPARIFSRRVPTSQTTRVEADISNQRAVRGVAGDTPDVGVQVVEETGDQTVRGVRLEAPPAVRQATDRNLRGRTVFGTVDGRPTLGTPEVDLGDVDFRRAGGDKANQGPVFEPQGRFETDVFTASARSEGGDVAERVGATEDLLGAGESIGRRAETRDPGSVEEVVDAAEEIGDEVDSAAVTDALAESDATIFGSGAVRAQAPGFRDPGDIDVVVPDKQATKSQLSEALEGSDTGVGAFDIKEAGDFQGLDGGEVFGFGRRSQDPIESPEGVRVNPIGEELQRKAGASAFFRGDEVGDPGVDVGPRPARGPDTPVRQKDVEDAAAIGRSLLGEEDAAVRGFENAFGLRESDVPPAGEPRGGLLPGDTGGAPAAFGEFVGDVRGQADLGGVRRGVDDAGAPARDVPDRPRDADAPTSPVPRQGDAESPIPGVAPGGSPFGPVSAESPSAPDSPDATPRVNAGTSPSAPPASEPSPQAGPFGSVGSPAPDSPDQSPQPSPGPTGSPPPSEPPGPSPDPSPVPSPTANPFGSPSPSPSPEPSPSPAGGAAEQSPAPVFEFEPLGESGRRPRDDGAFTGDTDRDTFDLQPQGRATPEFRNPIAQLFPGVEF